MAHFDFDPLADLARADTFDKQMEYLTSRSHRKGAKSIFKSSTEHAVIDLKQKTTNIRIVWQTRECYRQTQLLSIRIMIRMSSCNFLMWLVLLKELGKVMAG